MHTKKYRDSEILQLQRGGLTVVQTECESSPAVDEFTSTVQVYMIKNNLHIIKTTELDETHALLLFPNE